jgi:hypothetical protein
LCQNKNKLFYNNNNNNNNNNNIECTTKQNSEERIWIKESNVTRRRRKQRNVQLHNLSSMSIIVRMFGSRGAGWAEHGKSVMTIKFVQPIFQETKRNKLIDRPRG